MEPQKLITEAEYLEAIAYERGIQDRLQEDYKALYREHVRLKTRFEEYKKMVSEGLKKIELI